MPSMDASTCFLIAGFALAIWLLLRRRQDVESTPARRPLTSVRALPESKPRDEGPAELLRWQVEV